MRPSPRRFFLPWSCLLTLAAFALGASPAAGQVSLSFERDRQKVILETVSREIEKNFYDPTMRGLDWKALTSQARERIESAKTVSEMVTAIFSLVNKLQDSHTVFLPPGRIEKPLFGFEAKAFGEEIRIYELKKKGAALKAGLQLGDRVLGINGYRAERNTFDLLMLYLRALRPTERMEITIARGDEPPQQVVVPAEIKHGQVQTDLTNLDNIYQLIREAESQKEVFRYFNHEGGIGYLQLPEFPHDEEFLYGFVKEIKKSRAAIIDLRGNPGGAVKGFEYFTGFFEDKPVVVAEMVGRKKTEPVKIKPKNPNLPVPLYILVDSQTASAGEIFARHFQRNGRGVVIGDRTSGRVTAAKVFPNEMGVDIVVFYAIQVTVARVIFPGGEELEKRGVTPDHACIPTAEQLREEKDLCRGMALAMARKTLGLPESTEGEKKEEKKEEKKH